MTAKNNTRTDPNAGTNATNHRFSSGPEGVPAGRCNNVWSEETR